MQRIVLRGGVRRAAAQCIRAPVLGVVAPRRHMASAASAKVLQSLQAEIKHEDKEYEQAKEIQQFLKGSEFKCADSAGDVNVALERTWGDKVVKVEWQLSSPFDPDAEETGEDAEVVPVEFCVTIENRSKGSGIQFFCGTQAGEDYRYVIGNVKSFASTEERDSISAYNGPEFDDIDDKLQEAFNEYLSEALVDDAKMCDFIDAVAHDKEQREYLRWLKTLKSFVE